MGKRGPSRTPERLRVIAGTDRKDRPDLPAVEFPVIDGVPSAPDWLPNSHAVKEWERLAPILVASHLMTEAGISALGTLCALHGKLVQLWAAGESPNASLVGQYRGLINDFGLTPVAQGRIKGAAREEDNGNRFERFGKRPA